VASALDKESGEVFIKLVNPTDEAIEATISVNGANRVEPKAKLLIIVGDKAATNSVETPDVIKTETWTIKAGETFDYTMPAMSVQFIRVKA